MEIRFTLNGRSVTAEVEKRQTLLSLIRDRFYLTGTKYGCGTGDCGACKVLLDGEAVTSCNLPSYRVDGRSVVTIEGINGENGALHPVQQAFLDAGAVQCGFCTPGMVIQTIDLLNRNPDPDEEEIREALKGNICRCTGYVKIVQAVKNAAEAMGLEE